MIFFPTLFIETLILIPMGMIKPFNYTKAELLLALNGRAIVHPCRNRILSLLLENDSLTNAQIQEHFRISKATARDHVQKLTDAGFLTIKYQPHKYIIRLHPKKRQFARKIVSLGNELEQMAREANR